MKVIISPEARSDLLHITEYLAERIGSTALAVVDDLYDKCISLADAPHGYVRLPRYEHLGIRRRPVGNYLILYRVGRTIEVIRVLHAARDYEHLLFPKK